MASTLDRIRRQIEDGSLQTVNTGAASTSRRSNVARLEDEARRNNRFNQYADRALNDEVFTQEEIDDMRQSRSRTVQRQEQQDYYRRQAEQALAQFEANERARQWDAELGERHGFAADREAREYERRLQEAMRTARREAYSDPEYRAYNREIWKDTQRLQSNLDYAKQQAGRTVAAAQRQRDRIRNGSSRLPDYWERHAQAQEQKQYGSYMDRMSQPVRQNEVDEDQLRAEYGTDYTQMLDRSQSVQPDMNAASRYGQALGRPDSAMAEIDAKEAAAKRVKDYDIPRLQTVLDYEKSYGVSPALTGTSTWNPHEINTGVGKTGRAKDIAKAVYDSANGKITADTDEYNYNADLMTDAEKNTVINLAKAGKWAEILEYTDALQATLDAKTFDLQQQGIANMSKAAQAAYGMMGTVERVPAYLQIALDTVRGRYTDLNAGAVGATRLTNEARARSLENAGQVGQFVGNALYSTLDNAVLMPLGEVGALVWMSAGAAGQTAVETLEKGGTQGQALLNGAASGAVEYLTEKLPLENLFRIAEGKGIRGLKDYLLTVAKHMGTEGAEELVSEFADTFLDRAIMGQKSEYLTRIRELEADGSMTHDEAVSRANFEFFVKNPGLAAAAGALSGGFMAGASAGINAINTARADLATGRDIANNRQIADLVLDEGMKSTDERVKALSYALDTVRQENRNSEGFQWSRADLREIGEVYDSLDNAAKKRISDDYAERERTRQEEEAERVRAREAEIQAEQDARAREDAQRALAEREAETDRIVEDAEAIDLDNPEALTEEADTTARRGSDEYTDRVETTEDVDADMRRRAAAAEEATRTGDRSALDNLEQPRRTTESTAQTNRQTAQQEPVNPTQQRRDMKKQVRNVYSSMGITSEVSVGEIADAMQEAYNAIREKGDGSDSLDERKAFLSAAQEHFEEDMLRQAEEDRDRQFGAEDEVYTQARKTIRGTRLYVPQSLNASELGVDSFNEFRRANFGVLNLTRDSQAMPIDTFYDELVREYPGLFPASDTEGGPTSEADMLRTIAEVYRSRGSAMQAEPIDTDAINAESKRKAMELYRPMVEAAQQAYTTAQTTARQNAEQAGQTTATNARRAGLSAADSLALSNVARDLGVGLEFRKMKYGRVNGFYNRETNTVVLNQDLSTAEMAWTTFAHEITHAAETAGSYNQLRDIAKQYGTKGTTDEAWRLAIDEMRRDYAKAGVKLTKDGAEFELVANTMEKILGSREAVEGVVRESREQARALLSSVNNVADRVTTNNTAITPEAARLVQAQKALAAALSEAQEQRNTGTKDEAFYDDDNVQYSLRVSDPSELDFLNDQETVTTYKTMQLIDGKLYPPMAAVVAGSTEDHSVIGQWEKAVEHPELITSGNQFTLNKGKGQGSLKAAYNPYMHSSNLMINDQFSGAYNRPNLVTVECEVPVSELTSGYHADHAKDSVGWHSWHTGTVAGQLRNKKGVERQVLLSRWIKPVRILSDAEVAQHYAELLSETDIQVPDNVVTPSLLNELKKAGVPIKESGKVPAGAGVQYSIRTETSPTVNPSDDVSRYKLGVDAPKTEASVAGVDVDDIYRRALEKYGRMRSGEQLVDEQGNPVTRETTLPKQTSDETRTRGLYRTADEANSVTVDVKTRAVLDQYKPTSNQENVDRANEMRGKYSNFDQAYGAWQDMVDKGLSSRYGVLSNQIAFAETLFMEAQREGRIQEAYTILSDLAQFGTTAGQAVQALSLIKRLSPEGQLMHYNRVVENFANSGKKGKVPADVQTAMQTIEINEGLLNKLEELRKLKRFEDNGGKMTENVARRIAELEKEIEALQTKLGPLLDKFNRLTGEKNATTLERNKLKREEKALPDRIKATEDRIAEIQTEIDELNKKLDPKRKELLALLPEEGTTRERRKELKKELDSINRRIETKQRQIAQHRADILALMAQMSVKNIKLPELQRYERVLKTSKEIMDTYLRYTKNKGGRVVVPAELQTEYLNAKTDAEREAVRAKMDVAIAEQLPGTWSEKIRGWRYISMLFNPTTHLRNMAGNTVQYGLKGMRDTIATGLEHIFIRGDGERTKAIANRFIPADKAYFTAAEADYKTIKGDLQAGGKASETQGIENLRKIYGNKYAEAVRRFSGDLLEREDAIFLRANYTQSFAEYLKANKIDPANMTDEQRDRARQIAFQQALEATYRDASTIASVLNDLEKKGAGWEFALGGIMPFKKTPVNVLKRGVEYSPAGIIKATYDMIQATRGKNAKTKADIIGEYASGLTGTIVAALGMFAARAGIAFASPGDDDKDRKKAMDEATGQQDYAIKFNIGGKEWTYTFDWVAPASMAFFAGVRAVEAFRSKDKIDLQGILDGLITTINPIFELSMLDGLTGMFRSYASDESGAAAAVAWSILESYILQFFPTVGGKLARTIDPYQRSTYSPKDSAYTKNLERLYRRVMAKIPGASYMLEPIIDQYGNPKENIGKNFIGRLGYNLTSPGYYKPVTHYAADEEMKRLYAQVGETYVLPKEMPTSWEFDGETYYLDSTEYRKWGERQGKYVYDELDKLYQTQEYKAANDTQKAKMVGKVIEAGTQYAKLGFFEDIGLIDDYYRHELDGLVYDDTQGYRQYKTIPEATEIYEQGRIDLKTVYDANETLKGISGNAARIDAMNKMNLDSDEYNFLYMTKIANNEMEADISAVINAGGSLDRAVNIVSQFYKWDANAENKTTGEKGAWVSIGNGAKAEVLAKSNMTLPAIETMYLRVLTPADDVEKQTELINEFKSAGKNIKDYLNTKAVLYDGGVSKYKKTSDIAQAFLDSDLPDDLKELGYKTLGSDAQGVPDEIAAFKKARMSIDDYLRTKAVVGKTDADGNGLKNYEKARELLKMDLKSYTAAITSVITSSENQATGIQNCLNVGISDRKVAEGYAKYAQINANDALNATQKATEFSKWLNTDKSMSNLTTAQKDMMRASFVYFMMTPASAGRYDNLMKLDGMSSAAAESISADIAKLEPKEGSKSVSDLQRLTAVAYNTTASEKQIDLAMQQILDSSDDGTDTAGLTKYRAIRAAGMSAKQYVDFRTNTESITSDKDSNGKDIKGRTRQDKIWAYINSLPISSKQKDALHLVYYKESTLSKTPWH